MQFARAAPQNVNGAWLKDRELESFNVHFHGRDRAELQLRQDVFVRPKVKYCTRAEPFQSERICDDWVRRFSRSMQIW